MEFHIRSMDKESRNDWELFDRLQLDSFRGSQPDRHALSEEEIETRFRKFEADDPIDYAGADQFMYIAETGAGQPAGIVWFADRKPFWRFEERHVWIYNLNVIADFRRRGIATLLLHVAENFTRENSLPFIALHVLDFNTGARALYERLGYKLVETHNESCFYQKNIK